MYILIGGVFYNDLSFFLSSVGLYPKRALAKFVEMRMRGEIEFIYYILKIILAVSYGDHSRLDFSCISHS